MPTSVTARVAVDLEGPFFKGDPTKTLLENVRRMMEGIAQEGAIAAREGLQAGQANRLLIRALGDRVSDHVVGRTESRQGKEWWTAAVVQVYNEGLSVGESRSLMAAASDVEAETHAIRSVTRQLRSARAVLRANLTQGLE